MSALVKRINQVLEHLDVSEGRDLFPGAGYVSSDEPMPLKKRLERRWGQLHW
jgi:hypothetical protein